MKIGTFIKIIADSFSSQIAADPSTNRISDQIKYQTVLTWFTPISTMDIDTVNDVINKSENFCNKVMNENSSTDMPITDASRLKSKISEEEFESVFNNANLDDFALNSLVKKFKDRGITISKNEIPKSLAKTFYNLLDKRSEVNKKGSIRNATFLDDSTVKIGTKTIKLPSKLSVPNLPAKQENIYVEALLRVYAQREKKGTISISDLDTMSLVYKTNLQMCREDFYSAESVLHKVRDLFTDSIKEFDEMKNEIYQGIKYTLNSQHVDGFDRLNKTLSQVILISFRKSYFSTSGNGLVGPEEERGMIHMLVNEGRIEWIREDLDDASIQH
ncbi:MAG TPA: hypothetical protein PLT36_06950 [Erysipelotrichaceae bacterium]|nr:hypothetical protein [Erysipelotrichaceae bacterium]